MGYISLGNRKKPGGVNSVEYRESGSISKPQLAASATATWAVWMGKLFWSKS